MRVDMRKGSPVAAVLRFSLPLMLGNIFQLFYNLADAAVVGRYVSSAALAAVGAVGPVNSLLVGFAMGLTNGFAIPVAERFGAGDLPAVRKTFGNALTLTLGLSAALTAVSLALSRPLLRLIDTPQAILEDANTYAVILYCSIVFMMLYNMMAAMLRALGDSRSPLIFLILSSVVNVLLDLFFVLVLHWTIAGVAVASAIGNAVSVVLCAVLIYRVHPELHVRKADLVPDAKVCRSLLSMGLPMALQLSVTAVGSMILQSAVNRFGEFAVAAVTAGSRVENIVNVTMSALGVSLSTFTAQNRGAKLYNRILYSVRRIFLLDLAISLFASLFLWFCGEAVCSIFLKDSAEQILPLCETYLRTLACFYWALAVLFVFRNFLQGLGYGYTSVLAGAAELVGRVLVAFVLAGRFGFSAVCLAGPMAWMLADVPLLCIYFQKRRRLKRLAAETESK